LLAAGADPVAQDSSDRTPLYNMRWHRNRRCDDIADLFQSIVDDPSKRPTPQDVGLNMAKREAALAKIKARTEQPVVGNHTARSVAERTTSPRSPGG
jgi:hypothetical protein